MSRKSKKEEMDAICTLKDIYKELYQFEKKFQIDNGMTINEAMLLCCLHQRDAKSAGTLCEFIGLSSSRVSKVINSVEKMGYIQRTISSEDKRQMLFSLTAEGWRKITEMEKVDLHIQDLYAKLSDCLKRG